MSVIRRAPVVACMLAACFQNDDIPAPLIASIVPDHAPAGAIVQITGDHFCQLPEAEDPTCTGVGTVQFGTTPGTASTWSDTSIMVEVPQGPLGLVDVTVTAKGRTSNRYEFRVD